MESLSQNPAQTPLTGPQIQPKPLCMESLGAEISIPTPQQPQSFTERRNAPKLSQTDTKLGNQSVINAGGLYFSPLDQPHTAQAEHSQAPAPGIPVFPHFHAFSSWEERDSRATPWKRCGNPGAPAGSGPGPAAERQPLTRCHQRSPCSRPPSTQICSQRRRGHKSQIPGGNSPALPGKHLPALGS
ncbi:hypothetical protein DV515_00018397 [Chloebia gouldiae]|uniref:Uncharacterized protein n=1 Tax=Chloebia gouldiae TaxID=44316 RepID=A0A3L8Q7L7_CHLGU|nr:hypothetical protein DV515_00018396 [Chloebia gouldiae]RLV63315.1 hypothetical protein DV515_00018397 [Chloebia gouldiae]